MSSGPHIIQRVRFIDTSNVAASALLATSGGAPLLLDGITGISGVWSFRRLVSAYAGNCVKIRRSSDNTTQDFGFISDVVDAAGIVTFIGGGSGFIDTLYGQKNSLNLVQPTTGSQWPYNATAINSLPGIDNSGNVGAVLKIASLDITAALMATNQMTYMSVSETSDSGNQNQAEWEGPPGDGSNRFTLFGPLFGSHVRADFGNSLTNGILDDVAPAGYVGNPHVNETYHDTGGNVDIIVDGTSAGSGSGHSSSLVSGSADFLIGGGFFGYVGLITEIIIANVALGSTDRATIRKNGTGSGAGQKSMGTYYGITVS